MKSTALIASEGLKEWVDKALANMIFLDAWGTKRLLVSGEVLAQPGDFLFALVKRLAHG